MKRLAGVTSIIFWLALSLRPILAQELRICPPCSGRYCQAIRQKLISINRCWQNAETAQLQSRLSDAGYFYCTRKQQFRETPAAAIRGFETIRPPRDATEADLDQFAVEAAVQMLCP
ncbi:hypothetical protein ACFFWD_26195 [Bradyrhizobium erythrophlei]|uniref:hypothetical protein n=1 Tax=Bradyrhizobium erythrophlei TaxID=1437360 RepID=UPI0035E997A3